MDPHDPYSHDWDEWEGQPRPLSVGVVVVAVANFVVGGLALIAGLTVLAGGEALAASAMQQMGRMMGSGSEALLVLSLARDTLTILAAVTLLFGALAIASGIGVIQQSAWGRLLSLLLGFVAAALGVLSIVALNMVTLVLYGGYALITLIVLFDRDYSRRFQ